MATINWDLCLIRGSGVQTRFFGWGGGSEGSPYLLLDYLDYLLLPLESDDVYYDIKE